MENAPRFREKLRRGQIPLGCGVSFTDPTVSELFSHVLDFVWIDMEHNALSLETVQSHITEITFGDLQRRGSPLDKLFQKLPPVGVQSDVFVPHPKDGKPS